MRHYISEFHFGDSSNRINCIPDSHRRFHRNIDEWFIQLRQKQQKKKRFYGFFQDTHKAKETERECVCACDEKRVSESKSINLRSSKSMFFKTLLSKKRERERNNIGAGSWKVSNFHRPFSHLDNWFLKIENRLVDKINVCACVKKTVETTYKNRDYSRKETPSTW